MIHALIVHDVLLIRDLMTTVLEGQGFMVVDNVSTLSQTMEFLRTKPCNIVLVNALLPNALQLAMIRTIAKQHSGVKIVIVGMVESKTFIVRCLEAGASGYVLESDGVEQLLAVVRGAIAGEAFISPAVAAALILQINQLKRLATELNGFVEADMEQQAAKLTPREQEILTLVGAGHSNRDIADDLFITIGTVKNHVHNILDKLDVHTRKQAAMVSRQLDLGEPKAEDGTTFTWPESMGIRIASRRDAAAML